MSIFTVFSFIIGTFIGSFLNVCIYRLPIGESIVFPPSRCPKCNARLKALNLVPVFSYLFQGGKCAYCKEKIAMRYPLVELLTGIIYALVVYKFGISMYSFSMIVLSSLLIVSTFTDFSHQIIPDKITLPGIIIGFLASVFFGIISPLNSLIGILAGGGLLYGVLLISILIYRKEGMGGGDIKLAAMIGSFLGWREVLGSLAIAMALGGIIGLFLIVCKLKSREDYIPFGPYIVLGSFMVIFFRPQLLSILQWYLGLLR